MSRETLIALRATIVTLLLTGLIYPLVLTGLAQVIFPWQANGSLYDEKVGSSALAPGDLPLASLRQRGQRRRAQAGGFGADRAGLHRLGLLLAAALGRRLGI